MLHGVVLSYRVEHLPLPLSFFMPSRKPPLTWAGLTLQCFLSSAFTLSLEPENSFKHERVTSCWVLALVPGRYLCQNPGNGKA